MIKPLALSAVIGAVVAAGVTAAVLTLSGKHSPAPTPPTQVTVSAQVLVDGLTAEQHRKADEAWQKILDEWNALPYDSNTGGKIANGQTFHTFEDWAKATRRPLNFDELAKQYRQ